MSADTCAICLIDIKKCGNVSQDGYTTLCGHYFHKNCLARWFNTSGKSECPMCRSDIKYDRGCVVYWPDGSVKRIQNARSDIGFYQNGKKKYKLVLNRLDRLAPGGIGRDLCLEMIQGGEIWGRFRFEGHRKLDADFIGLYGEMLVRMAEDGEYDIWEDLV